jgi:hypothetical protein
MDSSKLTIALALPAPFDIKIVEKGRGRRGGDTKTGEKITS